MKIKGIVDVWRNPRPDYYHVKMVYSPVKIESAKFDGQSVTLHAVNHYSFTDLSKVNATWQLLAGKTEVAGATTHLDLAPLSNGDVKLNLPADALTQADTLRIDFDHPGGWNVVTYQFPVREHENPAPAIKQVADLNFPALNLCVVTFGKDDIDWRQANRRFGHMQNINVAGRSIDEAQLHKTPLSRVPSVDADIVLEGSEKPAGEVHATFSNGHFDYQITWQQDKSDIQQLGWAFLLPKSCDHFSWDRRALWSYYPPTHIGRPTGTALPDTAACHFTKLERPDAFDFNSTKYDCNWASLADTSGNGILVRFTKADPHHCRGDITDSGYRLIVNKQCSPARDISSNIVPDLYLTLNKGSEVKGGFEIGR